MEKTHWRKNLDKRYISGEDLLIGEKGLRKEMTVVIEKQSDAPAFDQSTQKETQKTALYMKEFPSGPSLYKPALLNVTRARFLEKETGSQFLEDWYGHPFVMYAKPDSRHGHVVAFKKYIAPPTATPDKAIKILQTAGTLEELGKAWETLTGEEKKLPAVLAEKDRLKGTLK